MSDTPKPPPEPVRDLINSIAFAMDQILNGKGVENDASMRKNGFVLLIYPFGFNDGRANIITNGASHTEMVEFLRTQLSILEKKQ